MDMLAARIVGGTNAATNNNVGRDQINYTVYGSDSNSEAGTFSGHHLRIKSDFNNLRF
jgi:hypothetical protein